MKIRFNPQVLGRNFTVHELEVSKSLMAAAVLIFGRPDVSLVVARWASKHLAAASSKTVLDLHRLEIVNQYLLAARMLVLTGESKSKPTIIIDEALEILDDDPKMTKTLGIIGSLGDKSDEVKDGFRKCVFILNSIADLKTSEELNNSPRAIRTKNHNAAASIRILIAQIHASCETQPSPIEFVRAEDLVAASRFGSYNCLCFRCVVLRYLHMRAKRSGKELKHFLRTIKQIISDLKSIVQRKEVSIKLMAADPDLQILREIYLSGEHPCEDEERHFLKIITLSSS